MQSLHGIWVKTGINSLSIDSKITFDGKHSRLDISGDAKRRLLRRAIAADVDNIKTSANYYHSSRDNDYYNNVTTDSGKKQITVSVPIKTGNANNHVEAKIWTVRHFILTTLTWSWERQRQN